MVLDNTAKSKSEFSIERLESEMLSAKITYKQINKELGYDVEKMLKDKRRKPMLNVIGKVCTCIGLKNTDYVMMKTDQPEYEKIKPEYTNIKDGYISTSIIYHELLDLYVKESAWSYETISTLMHSKSILRKGVSYLKQTQKISKDDINNLCYALSCKISDICDIKGRTTEAVPPRVLNKRQIYLLNSKFINELPQINKICEYAKIPEWFICNNKKVYVSEELLNIICNSIKQVTGKDVTYKEICNCVSINKKNNKNKTVSNETKDKNVIIEEEKEMTIAGTMYNEGKKLERDNNPTSEIKEIENADTNKSDNTNLNEFNRKKHYYKNNNSKQKSNSFMRDMYDRIKNMSDEDLDKLEKCIALCKRHRIEIKELLE